ncbi:hypothetical protein GPECTOR_20g445 [Gonium pectorale]|uniref:Uncharacterized protein n=1 Tax=Gonium pectorale TaxID=33097 RepID=A0A150GIF5_GONPE|nr:hypothetical protein GPECTOR_20g445 [Gonium pectorale]|eukprot:KXZ49589.1 hypothetical protein GPECTOR_20g445 [Gonium pectorale]
MERSGAGVQSAGAVLSEMPKPNYPNDWRTVKQLDFRPDALARSERAPPVRAHDAGRLLPSDVPPGSQFASTSRAVHVGPSAAAAAAVPPSGSRGGTRAAGYNIITGAPPLGNNAFEAWDGRDYRRHR